MTLVELAPLFSLFGGAVGAALTNAFLTRWFAANEERLRQRRIRWLPLLEAAEDLRARFADLQDKYRNISDDRRWRRVKVEIEGNEQEKWLPTWVRDFQELYTFSENPNPLRNLEDDNVNPVKVWDDARKNEAKKALIRIRMGHQLNYAASTLYKVARYLGYAQRVRKDLSTGRLDLQKDEPEPEEIESLLKETRQELHGTSEKHRGAGILLEQQDFIGEIVWGPAVFELKNLEDYVTNCRERATKLYVAR